jgi:ATP-dependent DNA helicase PIF1
VYTNITEAIAALGADSSGHRVKLCDSYQEAATYISEPDVNNAAAASAISSVCGAAATSQPPRPVVIAISDSPPRARPPLVNVGNTADGAASKRPLPLSLQQPAPKRAVHAPAGGAGGGGGGGDLSPEQQLALAAVLSLKNVFITGPGGTGKSYLIERITKSLAEQMRKVEVVASTGTAAQQVDGQTMNAFFGYGIPRAVEDFKKMANSALQTERIRSTDVLIIEEVSMVSGELLDNIDPIIRRIRGREHEPFGGMQIVFVGDFFQLPPVRDRAPITSEPKDTKGSRVQYFLNRGYAFESKAWLALNVEMHELTRSFRQSDQVFVNALNEVRYGRLGPEAQAVLSQCARPLTVSNGIVPTKLYCKNANVDAENSEELQKLPGRVVQLRALNSTPDHMRNAEQNPFWRSCLAAPVLHLKEGAQVMLLRNDPDKKLVNGSKGIIIGFITRDEAIKSCDRGPKGHEQTKWLQYQDAGALIPRVLFLDSKAPCVILPETFSHEVKGQGTLSRQQIPLMLSWAITVHKSQGKLFFTHGAQPQQTCRPTSHTLHAGMSLDYVVADLRGTFSAGQVYVALSRARRLDGLQIIGLAASNVRADATVSRFYEYRKKGLPYTPTLWMDS